MKQVHRVAAQSLQKMKTGIQWNHQRMDRKEDKYFTVAEIAAVFLWEHMKPILTNEIPAFICHIL